MHRTPSGRSGAIHEADKAVKKIWVAAEERKRRAGRLKSASGTNFGRGCRGAPTRQGGELLRAPERRRVSGRRRLLALQVACRLGSRPLLGSYPRRRVLVTA